MTTCNSASHCPQEFKLSRQPYEHVNNDKRLDLRTVHVAEVVFPRPKHLICVTANASLADAIDRLRDGNVYAVPVVDKSGDYIGLLSQADILCFLLSAYPKEEEKFDEYFRTHSFAGFSLSETHCDQVIAFFKKQVSSPVVSSSLDMSVLFAMQLLNSYNVNRLPVLDEKCKRPVAVLSQFDLVRFLCSHHSDLSQGHQSLELLGIAEKDNDVVSAKPSDLVISTIRKMSANALTSIPVLDDAGRIDCIFSFMDVSLSLSADESSWLVAPMKEAKEADHFDGDVVTVHPRATLNEAMALCVERHMHSIHVVDDDHKLLRTLRLADFIVVFCRDRRSSY